jgi:hypothetical protein
MRGSFATWSLRILQGGATPGRWCRGRVGNGVVPEHGPPGRLGEMTDPIGAVSSMAPVP